MRLDKIHWVDLNEPKKQEYTFAPLNESTETPPFEYKTGATAKDSLKPQILATTLFDVVMKYRTNLVKESEEEDMTTQETLFDSDNWKSFKNHARLLAQLMTKNQQEIEDTITTLEEAFNNLSGGKGAEEGFKRIQKLQAILSGPDSPIEGLKPPPKLNNIIQLLLPEQYKVGRGKKAEIKDKVYDINMFIDFVTNRKNLPEFKGYWDTLKPNKPMSMGAIFQKVFQKKNETFRNKISDLFQKILNMNQYKKSGGAVGKAEIAMALFFKDCRLAQNKGDIEIAGRPIEVKGEGGAITMRLPKDSFPVEMFPGSYHVCRNIHQTPPKGFSDNEIWETLGLGKIDVTKQEQLKKVMDFIDKKVSIDGKMKSSMFEEAKPMKPEVVPDENPDDEGDEMGDEMGNEVGNGNNVAQPKKKGRRGVDISKNTWKDLVKFKILFSASFRAYATLEGFDSILGINTKNSERLFDVTASSPLMQSSIIKIMTRKKEPNWYKVGCYILTELENLGATVKLQDMMNENNLFKLTFLTGD